MATRTEREDGRPACPGCFRVPGDWLPDGGLAPCGRCLARERFTQARFRARHGFRPWAGEGYERPYVAFRVAVRAEVSWWFERARRFALRLPAGYPLTRGPWWRTGIESRWMVQPSFRGLSGNWIILGEAQGEGKGTLYRFGSRRLAWRLARDRWRGKARWLAEPAELAASVVSGIRRTRWRLRGFGTPWLRWVRYRERRRWINPTGRPLEPAQLVRPSTWRPWERLRRRIGLVSVDTGWPEFTIIGLFTASGPALHAEPAAPVVPPQGGVAAPVAGAPVQLAPLDEPAREGDPSVERAQRADAGAPEGGAEVVAPVPPVGAADLPRGYGDDDTGDTSGPPWWLRLHTVDPEPGEHTGSAGQWASGYKRVTVRWPGNDAAGDAGRRSDTESERE